MPKTNSGPATSPLLDRGQTCKLFNTSYGTVRRMEADGKLTPVKLRDGRTSKTFYLKSQVYALIGEPPPVD